MKRKNNAILDQFGQHVLTYQIHELSHRHDHNELTWFGHLFLSFLFPLFTPDQFFIELG